MSSNENTIRKKLIYHGWSDQSAGLSAMFIMFYVLRNQSV